MNKIGPKVSIILSTYNGAKYIRQSIDSCLNQTYRNIELIVVDDGSRDGSFEIIKSYDDKRMSYICHEKNMGLPCGLNTGFKKATGDYLTWTSDDNLYAENAIEKMLNFVESKDCEFVYCAYYRFKDEFKKNSHYSITNNHIGPCFLYSRKVKETIGEYDPDTILAEDYDYWLRVSKIFSIHQLNEPLYFFRVHKESLFSSKFYEVRAVDFLVRIKNNIIDIKQAADLYIDLIVNKNKKLQSKLSKIISCFIKLITFKKTDIVLLYKIFIKIRFLEEITRILVNYKMGNESFRTAKLKLLQIVSS